MVFTYRLFANFLLWNTSSVEKAEEFDAFPCEKNTR
jgi:hypothetical protein